MGNCLCGYEELSPSIRLKPEMPLFPQYQQMSPVKLASPPFPKKRKAILKNKTDDEDFIVLGDNEPFTKVKGDKGYNRWKDPVSGILIIKDELKMN